MTFPSFARPARRATAVKTAVAFALAACGALTVRAADVNSQWIGGTDGWNDAANWNNFPAVAQYPNNGNGGLTYEAFLSTGTASLESAITIESLGLSGGSIDTAGFALGVNQAMTWFGGNLLGAGSVGVAGGVSIGGGGSKTLDATFSSSSFTNWSGSNLFGTGTIDNPANASFNLQTLSGGLTIGVSQFNNAGTVTKFGGSGNSFGGVMTFNNTGILDVAGGTLNINGPVTQVSGTTLTGGTWNASNATLALNSAPTLSTIGASASVKLDGSSSVFSSINSLADNQGAFTVTNGRNFAPAGDLANSGTLTVGASSTFTLNVAFTNTGSADVAGTLIANQGIKGAGALSITGAGKVTVPEVTPNTYDPPSTVPSGSNATGSLLSSLSITDTGQLDLGNSDLAIDHDGTSALDQVRALLTAGFNGGGWDGAGGIISNTLNVNNPNQLDPAVFGIGYAENADLPAPYGTGAESFFGIDVDETTTLVKFTWVGDLNLDGLVDFQDLSVFNIQYDNGATSGRYWFEGDFNYDGVIDFQDLSLFNTNYDPSKPSLPEPGTFVVSGLVASAALAGRRRRGSRH